MENEELVAIDICCRHYGIEISFVRSLKSAGLIEVIVFNETEYLNRSHIGNLERMIRLHYEMEVNMEGIEVITHLLNKVDNLQEEVRTLRNRLSIYESEE